MKPTLKALGTKRLKLKYDKSRSSSVVNFNLRRYNAAWKAKRRHVVMMGDVFGAVEDWRTVGRCRLTLSNPCRKRLDLCS
jgi:hypothetical protein